MRHQSALARRTAAALVAVATPLATPARADEIHVPADVPTIQGAIALAADGDTVVVSQGTYFENIDFLGKDIVVTAGFAQFVDLFAAGPGSVVTFNSGESSAAVLQDFSINGGSGQPDAGSGLFGGGGVFVGGGAAPTLRDCTIQGNVVPASPFPVRGGGLLVVGGGHAHLENCSFNNNVATGGRGDAIATQLGAVTMTDCFIDFNGDAPDDAAIFGSSITAANCDIDFAPGTGADIQGDASFSECRFLGNAGWGLVLAADPAVDLSDCLFKDNGLGAALLNAGSASVEPSVSVSRCVFIRDRVDASAAGPTGQGPVRVSHCTFDDGDVLVHGGALVVRNSIFRGSPGFFSGAGTTTVTYSDVQGGWPGTGNIDADPLWTFPGIMDYSLLPGSPCINTGDPAEPLDPDGSPTDMGAVTYQPWVIPFNGSGAIGGTFGLPHLEGSGPLIPGTQATLTLTDAAPNQPILLVIGGAGSAMLFKGGSLWPNPPLMLVAGLPTDGAGSLSLTGTWPPGTPSATKFAFQVWFEDAGAPFLWAASNGLFAASP
jgi:hypothetical protein